MVLVIIDTLRADAPSYTGHPRETTPYLDHLALSSTWFDQAFASSSWTLPSVATLLTGLQPWQHRVVRTPGQESYGRLEGHQTLAQAFKERGYRTAAFVNNAYLAPEFGFQRGFDVYDYQGADPVEHRSAHATTEAAISWFERSDDPAFLLVHIMEPHLDYDTPAPFKGRFTSELPHTLQVPLTSALPRSLILRTMEVAEEDRVFLRHAYDEEVLTADDALGLFLEKLKTDSGWDEMRLAITSDHGEEFWDHGGFEHGHTLFSELTRVPLILKLPSVVPGRNTSLVEHQLLYEALLDGSGDLVSIARSGQHREGRVAISEATAYGNQLASIADRDLRLVVDLEGESMALWRRDASGRETELIEDPNSEERSRVLFNQLGNAREGLAPTEPTSAVEIGSREIFEKLKALGYVE